MTVIECEQCGTEYDTEREHTAGTHADTQRCSYCGTRNEVEDDDQRPPVSSGGSNQSDAEIEITMTIQVHGGDVNVREK